MLVRAFASGDEQVCEAILRALPQWFGIESSLVAYAADSARLPTWIACNGDSPIGFITARRHFPESFEIHCLAVLPEHHRAGAGRMLVDHVVAVARRDGARMVQVKTLGPSRPCEWYDRTRRFYEALGFAPLEEFHTLWEGNPCLQMVRAI